MEAIKQGWQRFLSYGWKGHLFIFASPVFGLEDVASAFLYPDVNTWARYIVRSVMCWVLIELITQAKEGKQPKKRTYTRKKKV